MRSAECRVNGANGELKNDNLPVPPHPDPLPRGEGRGDGEWNARTTLQRDHFTRGHRIRFCFLHNQNRHAFSGGILLKFFPGNEKRIVSRHLTGIFIRAFSELFRLAKQQDCFRRQIIEERSQTLDSGLRTLDSGLWTLDSGLRTLDLPEYPQLTRWRNRHGSDFFPRNLGQRIKVTQRLQLIAEEFHPHRPRADDRINVKNAAT